MIEKKQLKYPDGTLIETVGEAKSSVQKAYQKSMAAEVPTLRSWKQIQCEININEGMFQKPTIIFIKADTPISTRLLLFWPILILRFWFLRPYQKHSNSIQWLTLCRFVMIDIHNVYATNWSNYKRLVHRKLLRVES